MNANMNIKDIILSQKAELEEKLREPYVKRDDCRIDANSPLIQVISGPRRSGKSFFATHYLKEYFHPFGYFNFDDERIAEIKNYDDIVNAINIVYGNPKTILFDEIQNLPKWELFLNRLQRKGLNLVVTGSNSNLLSRELATHLTGRHSLITILPFSFSEYIEIEGREMTDSEKAAKVSAYIQKGGYPEPLLKNLDRREYLSMLVNSIVYKDIVKRYKIRFVQGIEGLTNYLISNAASEASFNQLARLVGVKSSHTAEKYFSYLKEAFLFFDVRRFSYKVREQLASHRKVYAIDNGLIYAKAFQMSANFGVLFENAAACELLRRSYKTDSSIYYYKNAQQEEVDFVVKRGNSVEQLIQVCYDISNPDTYKREIRALLKAGSELRCNDLLIINSDIEKTEDAEWFGAKGRVKFIPMWKWLLKPL